ncbi:hypothetical protein ACWKSR_11585, partial [Campylobacter fetus subsp. venerealis]
TKDTPLTIYNSEGVTVSDFSFDENGKAPVRVLGSKTSDITFDKKDFKSASEISVGNGASEAAVKLK